MDATPGRHPYRCLPLTIANAHGWQVLTPQTFIASWDGGEGKEAVHIVNDLSAADGDHEPNATSHFGNGVLTFSIDGLFRTDPGYDLWVGGPINEFKDGIQPLTGIVETDWSPFTFTMNWKFTRSNKPVVFEKEEPFCMLFPLARGALEQVEPHFVDLSVDPELESEYRTWSKSRDRFNADLEVEGSTAGELLWQKHYMRGETFGGLKSAQHRTRIQLPEFD